jgi:hyperosmotically inducible periplasmic protein
MQRRLIWILTFFIILLVLLVGAAAQAGVDPQEQKSNQRLEDPRSRDVRRTVALGEEVRHQLVTLPYHSVFDWLQAEVKSDGTVVLMGQVTQPTIKKNAESRVKELEGVSDVVNNIEVLPLSRNDDDLRAAVYRAIYRFDSPLFKYAIQSIPPMHIIVKNGHVTLKGIAATRMDSQLAYTAARGVPGVFDVDNELQLETAESD